MTKIGHCVSEDGWISAENLASKLGMSSIRVAERLLTQITEFLDNGLLSFKTPQLGLFSNAGKKCMHCV